jgi:hypothetical protein
MAVEVTQGGATAAQRNGSAGEQWVYMAEDAPATNRDLLGGKGAGLAAMTQAGLPVPAAFTITTAAEDGQSVAQVYRLSPKTVFGFGKGDVFSQTRWRF